MVNDIISIILPYYNRKQLLVNTLDSFETLYSNRSDFEIVIIDDGSNNTNRLESIINEYKLNINIVRIEDNSDVNPCYVYNVGVRQSVGNILILSSPETFHTTDMFNISNDFEKLTNDTYLQFSVFCLVAEALPLEISELYSNLGKDGYCFANEYGSWYTHSVIRSSCLNFFSAITRETYYKLSGFDERFRHGTGYDDEEFKLRVLNHVDSVIWYDNAIAIHRNHEIVENLPPTTNLSLFKHTRKDIYKHNDTWGLL